MQRKERRKQKRQQEKIQKKMQELAQEPEWIKSTPPTFIGLADDLAKIFVYNNNVSGLISAINDGTLDDLHAIDPETGENLLHISTKKNFTEISRILIFNKVSLVKRSYFNGRTCLHHAASRNNYFIVKELLEAGADPLIEDYEGTKSSDLSSGGEVKQLLKTHEAGARKKKDIKFQLFFHILNSEEDVKSKQETIMSVRPTKQEIDELIQKYIATHPFWNAIATGDEESVKEYIAQKQDINEVLEVFLPFKDDTEIPTPLFIAFKSGNRNIIKILLNAGVDVSNDLLANAIKYDYQEVIDYCLNKYIDCANELLYIRVKKKGESHKYTYTWLPPLHWAAWHGRLEIIKRLCEAGADIHAVTINGNVLHMAVHNQDKPEIVSYLVEKGAKVNEINKCAYPATALDYAFLFKFPRSATVLIENGAIIERLNDAALPPIHFAINMNSLSLVKSIYERDETQRETIVFNMDPIQFAQYHRRSEILKYLISQKHNVDVDELVCIETPRGHDKFEMCVVHKKDCVLDEPRNEKKKPSFYDTKLDSASCSVLSTNPVTMFSKPVVVEEIEQAASTVVKEKKEKREKPAERPRTEKWKVKTKQPKTFIDYTFEKSIYTWFGGLISSDKIDCLRDFNNGFYLTPERYIKSVNSKNIDEIDALLNVDTNFDKYQGIKQLSLYPPVYVDLFIGVEGDPNARVLRKLKVQYEVKKKGTPSRIVCVKIPADEIDGKVDSKSCACLILGVKFLKKGFHDGYMCNKRLKVVIPQEFLTEYSLEQPKPKEEEQHLRTRHGR